MMFHAPYKIVLVDDDEDVCNLLEKWIKNHYGDRVSLTTLLTYDIAKEFISDNEVHIVICDIHLGDDHGEDIIGHCAKLERGMKVVGLSADMSLTTALECFSIGTDYFLDKPLSEVQVCNVIDHCIEHFRYWHHVIQSRVEQHKKDKSA